MEGTLILFPPRCYIQLYNITDPILVQAIHLISRNSSIIESYSANILVENLQFNSMLQRAISREPVF